MRFNSPVHLAAWRWNGTFPRIHDDILQLIVACVRGSRILDLGCSYGLLGERIVTQADAKLAVGIDADAKAVAQAQAAGIAAELHVMRIAADTLPAVEAIVRHSCLDVIVARRILPELFGRDLALGRRFAGDMARAGIREIFVEGRVVSEKSVNALGSIDAEVDLLSGSFREVQRVGAVSYLRSR